MKIISAIGIRTGIPSTLLLCCALFLPVSCQAKEGTPKDSTVKISPQKRDKKTPAPKKEIITNRKVVVYYLHTTFRCYSCTQIEKLTKMAVETEFVKELENGLLEMKVVNVEGPGNKHFIQDYKLYTKSVVLSDTRDNKEIRWKNLEKVWQLLRNDKEFVKYIQTEIRQYLEGRK